MNKLVIALAVLLPTIIAGHDHRVGRTGDSLPVRLADLASLDTS